MSGAAVTVKALATVPVVLPRRTYPLVLVLLVPALFAACTAGDDDGRSTGGRTEPSQATVVGDMDEVAGAFTERKDRYLAAMQRAGDRQFDHDAAIGALLLDRASRTGDTTEVLLANELIMSSVDRIEASTATNEFNITHGAPFTFLRIALQFGDEPSLLLPSTYDAIVWGERPDGSTKPGQSLLVFRDQLFAEAYDPGGLALDVRSGEPWNPASNGRYNGTENHKLQAVVAGMLLSDLYADEVVAGIPVKDDTPALDDQWHYFRDAFFRLSGPWEDGLADHFHGDVAQTEEDSAQYTRTHLGDYWLLRDLYSDEIVRAHAEVFLDRLLADWAEDMIGPVRTGAMERWSNFDPAVGHSHLEHVLGYLLFDSLGEPLPLQHPRLFRFGGWAHLSVALSDYHPGSPDFPLVLLDIARDKGRGYLVREGKEPTANWVEADFALGFRLNGRMFQQDHLGGFTALAAGGGSRVGRMVTQFHGETPFTKRNPAVTLAGVQHGRTAVLASSANDDSAPRLWVQDGFDAVRVDDGWIFVELTTSTERDVWLAVGTTEGGIAEVGDVDGGDVYELPAGAETLWEVGTSDDFSSLAGFREAVLDGRTEVADDAVAHESGVNGVRLDLHQELEERAIDGETVDWDAWRNSFSNPWGRHEYGETEAGLTRGGRSVSWDWSPGDGDFSNSMPIKSVDNSP